MERGKFLGAVRNLTVAAAIVPFVATSAYGQEQVDISPTVERKEERLENNSFLDQFDQYLKTDSGKAIAASLFILSVANAFYRLQKSWEQDSDRKFGEAVSSSLFFVLLSVNFLAQTREDIDSKITASMINAFSMINSIYMIESTIEADRKWKKRIPAFVTAASLLALSSIVSIDTVKNS